MDTQKIIAFLLGLITVVALGFVLDVTQPVVLPLTISLLFAFLFTPAIRFLMKDLRFPRGIAIFVVIIFIFGFFFLIGWFVYNSIQSFVKQYAEYQQKLRTIFEAIAESKLLARFEISEALFAGYNWERTLRETLLSISGSFMTFVGVIIIIMVVLIFLFLETPHFKVKLSQAYPVHTSRRIGIILEHITRQVSRYLGVKLLISMMTGVSVFVALKIIGMDFPIVWGALAVVLNFIPQLGSILFVIIAIFVSVIQFYPNLTETIAVGITMTGLQLLFGSFLDPYLSGERLNLSPVVILASLVFWGWLWGAVGALIAVPLTATIKIICENIPVLKPIGVLMGTGYWRRGKIFRRR